jgi:hypothetical protein
MRKVVALCVLAFAAPQALAHPPAPVDGGGRAIAGKLHRWIHQASVPLVRGRLQIRQEACPGHPLFVGCVFTARPRTLYLGPNARAPRLVLYHELGHVFDFRVLNNGERRRFKRILGIRRSGWFGGGLPPAEWFADAYSACATRLGTWRRASSTSYGYTPSRRQHRRACSLIRRAAAPRGKPPRRPSNPPRVIESAPPPPSETRPSGGCNLVDQLLTGCTPSAAPAPEPGPPAPGPIPPLP